MFKRYTLPVVIVLSFLCPVVIQAQEAVFDTVIFAKAKVLEISNERSVLLPGTDTKTPIQTVTAEVIDGPERGATPTFENDFTQLAVGDTFYIRHATNALDGSDFWVVSDAYRLNILGWLVFVLVALIFIFGGIQGVRGFASLLGSLLLIFYLLIPGLYQGYSPILVSVSVASLIIIIGSYVTHGFNRTTTAAIIGMVTTVVITGLAAYWSVSAGNLSGYGSEESVALNFDTRGSLDMAGLLFGGIMIGLLGVLYDVAIGQAVSVEELFSAGPHLSRYEVYKKAIRIGREHIGALINTLAIAYVGAALPLLLLLQSSTTGVLFILNNEMFATEIVRIVIGSIGIILAVPITTLIASYMLHKKPVANNLR